MGGVAGRGRVLRPEDRVPPEGLDRPRLAVRHDAGRFHDARAPRRRIRRTSIRPGIPGDAAPGHRRLDGALHRHPDRAPCRHVPGLAGPGPGGGHEYHRRAGRFCGSKPCKPLLRKASGSRSDLRNEKIGYKIREHTLDKGSLPSGRRRSRKGNWSCCRACAIRGRSGVDVDLEHFAERLKIKKLRPDLGALRTASHRGLKYRHR